MKTNLFRKKSIILWASFVLLSLIIFLMPLKYENISLAVHLNNFDSQNQFNSLVTVELQSEKDEYNTNAKSIDDTVYFKLFDSFLNENSEIILDTGGLNCSVDQIKGYAGAYNTSKDQEIFNFDDLDIQSEDGMIQIPKKINRDIIGKVENNKGIKLTSIFILFLIFVFINLCFVKNEKWKLFAKYSKISILCLLFFGGVFNLILDDQNYLIRPGDSATTIVNESYNNDCSEITFRNNAETMYGINIPVVYNTDANQEMVYIEVLNQDSEILYSTVQDLKSSIQADYLHIIFNNPVTSSQGKEYIIRILSYGSQSQYPVVFMKDETGIINLRSVSEYSYTDLLFFIGTVIFIIMSITIALNYSDFKMSWLTSKRLLYIFTFVFAIAQIVYYFRWVGDAPDELAHLSYVAYLLDKKCLIPDFNNMHIYDFANNLATELPGTVNYLGHPPLYYWLLAIIQLIIDPHHINVTLLRFSSIGFGIIALSIFFMLGYKYLETKKPLVHLTYLIGATSVPFFLYSFCGLNNDIFSLLGVAISFWGITRFEKDKQNIFTYLLLSLGIFVTVLSKITAGLVLIIAYLIYIVWKCIQEKSLHIVLNKNMLISVPFILLGCMYFFFIYSKFGSFQPHVPIDDMKNLTFYVDYSERSVITFGQYIQYYATQFLQTWSQINSHVSIPKSSSLLGLDRIVYYLIPLSPIILFNKSNAKVLCRKFVIAIFVGIIIAIVAQFLSAWGSYLGRGYMGGFQSRYYLCWIPVLAFGFSQWFNNVLDSYAKDNKIYVYLEYLLIGFILLSIYGSFIFTLLN